MSDATASTPGGVWGERALRLGEGLLVVFAAFLTATALAGPLTGALVGVGLLEPETVAWRAVRTVFQFLGFAVAVVGFLAITDDWGLIDLRVPVRREWLLVAGGVVGLLVLQFAATAVLQALGVSTGENQVVTVGRENPRFFLYMVVVSVFVVGPTEELLFRGVVQGLLRRVWDAVPAILVASALFGFVHVFAVSGTADQQVLYALVAAGLGCLLGYLYERTDNIAVPGLAHGVYNACLFLIQYAAVTA